MTHFSLTNCRDLGGEQRAHVPSGWLFAQPRGKLAHIDDRFLSLVPTHGAVPFLDTPTYHLLGGVVRLVHRKRLLTQGSAIASVALPMLPKA